ncbi:PilX N-terminal domain-containing pilus assembly protein [Thermodesulfobacteriota bacterium]
MRSERMTDRAGRPEGAERGSRRRTGTSREGGIALVITLLAMLFIALIGLGGLYLSNVEIQIAGNESDAQRAFMAAEGGLEHVKSRSSYFITAGPGLPASFPEDGVTLPYRVQGTLTFDREGNPPPGSGMSMKFFKCNYYTASATGRGRHTTLSEVEENFGLILPKPFVDN